MKVLHVCAVAFGLETLLLPQIDYLESRGVTVEAACSPDPRVEGLRARGYVVHEIPVDRRIAPGPNSKSVLERGRRMRAEKMITSTECDQLLARPLVPQPKSTGQNKNYAEAHITQLVIDELGEEEAQKVGYRIFTTIDADVQKAAEESLSRTLARVESEPLPDLLMVDGGKGQLGVLAAALSDAGLRVDAASIAKERDEGSAAPRVRRSGGLKAERIFLPARKDPVQLRPSSRGLLLLQRVRDESHRFAIEFQRDLRSRLGLTSILEELPGIGPSKRRALLRQLGSLRAVRAASEAELSAVPGISARDATTIRKFFDSAET